MKKILLSGIILAMSLDMLSAVTTDEIIAKARSHVGVEERLNNIQTLQYSGRMQNSKSGIVGKLHFLIKTPYKYYSLVDIDGLTRKSATNGFEGYMKQIDEKTGEEEFIILNAAKVKQMIITAVEKLNYLKGVKKKHGQVIYDGLSEMRGRSAHKLIFKYFGGIANERYFDVETGDLLATISSDNGLTLVEEEFSYVNEIRFASKVSAWHSDGSQVYVITFDEIKVNEEIEDDVFNIPMIKANR